MRPSQCLTRKTYISPILLKVLKEHNTLMKYAFLSILALERYKHLCLLNFAHRKKNFCFARINFRASRTSVYYLIFTQAKIHFEFYSILHFCREELRQDSRILRRTTFYYKFYIALLYKLDENLEQKYKQDNMQEHHCTKVYWIWHTFEVDCNLLC